MGFWGSFFRPRPSNSDQILRAPTWNSGFLDPQTGFYCRCNMVNWTPPNRAPRSGGSKKPVLGGSGPPFWGVRDGSKLPYYRPPPGGSKLPPFGGSETPFWRVRGQILALKSPFWHPKKSTFFVLKPRKYRHFMGQKWRFLTPKIHIKRPRRPNLWIRRGKKLIFWCPKPYSEAILSSRWWFQRKKMEFWRFATQFCILEGQKLIKVTSETDFIAQEHVLKQFLSPKRYPNAF